MPDQGLFERPRVFPCFCPEFAVWRDALISRASSTTASPDAGQGRDSSARTFRFSRAFRRRASGTGHGLYPCERPLQVLVKKSGRATLLVASIVLLLAISQRFAAAAPAELPKLPSSFVVAVGYADTEGRGPSSGNCTYCFPSPWCGSHDVQFIGSSRNYNGNPTDTSNCAGGDWDGGGILVTNTGTTTEITLTNLTVVFPLPASGTPVRRAARNLRDQSPSTSGSGSNTTSGTNQTRRTLVAQSSSLQGDRAIFAGTSSDGSYTCPTGNYPSGPTKCDVRL